MRILNLAILITLLLSFPSFATTTYYIRTDGGTPDQCTGRSDTAYSGAGTNQPCAWKRFLYATGWSNGQPSRLAPGDTVIIGTGKNPVGFEKGLPGCSELYPYDCAPLAIPSGLNTKNKTKILGKGYDTGCRKKPELYGLERVYQVLNLQGSSNVLVQCLDITDHEGCGEMHADKSFSCKRTKYPFGNWATTGVRISDSENLTLKQLDIHGLANRGVTAGRYKNIYVENVSIRGNPMAGWDGDLDGQGGNDGIAGKNVFKNFIVQWNGCVETYPGKKFVGCYTQGQGSGYGDGFVIDGGGTSPYDSGTVLLDGANISKNTSDGMDALYVSGDMSFDIRKSVFKGNVGQQIKLAGDALINDSVFIGNCAYFKDKPFTLWENEEPGHTGANCNRNGVCDAGENSTYCGADCQGFNSCRAYGNTMSFTAKKAGQNVQIYGSTIYGQGDVLIMSTGGDSCNGQEVLKIRNSILEGDEQYGSDELTAAYYAAGATGDGDGSCGGWKADVSELNAGNIIYNVKNPETLPGVTNADPMFAGLLKGEDYNVLLQSLSPARNLRNPNYGLATDSNYYPRKDASGAYEFGSVHVAH